MVSALSWCMRGCVVLAAAALLAGCSRVTVGVMRPASDGAEGPPVPVADLLIEPDRFPPRYPAEVLDDAAVNRVLQDIDGVPVGAVVTPRDCGPAPGRVDTAAVEGIDRASDSSLIVVVTRPAPPLSEKLEQLRACQSFEVGRGDVTSKVSATVLAAPPVDAEDTYAVEQTVTTALTERTTLTLAAQIGDTRVTATWLQDPAVDDPDTTSLDTLFSDAVLKLRRDG